MVTGSTLFPTQKKHNVSCLSSLCQALSLSAHAFVSSKRSFSLHGRQARGRRRWWPGAARSTVELGPGRRYGGGDGALDGRSPPQRRRRAGCATAWQPGRPWWPFLPLLSRRRGHAVSGGAATLGTPPSPAPSSSFLPVSFHGGCAGGRCAAGRRRDWLYPASSSSARGGGSRIWRPRRPAREVAARSSSSVAPSSPPPSWPAAVAGSRAGQWRGAGPRQAARWSGGGSSSRCGGEAPRPWRRGGGCPGAGRSEAHRRRTAPGREEGRGGAAGGGSWGGAHGGRREARRAAAVGACGGGLGQRPRGAGWGEEGVGQPSAVGRRIDGHDLFR